MDYSRGGRRFFYGKVDLNDGGVSENVWDIIEPLIDNFVLLNISPESIPKFYTLGCQSDFFGAAS